MRTLSQAHTLVMRIARVRLRGTPSAMYGALALILVALTLSAGPGAAASSPRPAEARKLGPSGLPLPRFVSLKADKVNVRRGPGWDYGIVWVFREASLPVEIIAEFDHWRKIRDSEGSVGWVYGSLLSGRRTGLVSPWVKQVAKQTFALRASASPGAALIARLGPAILVDVEQCDGAWCLVRVRNLNGWIKQDQLWGVYPGEIVK